MCCMYVKTINMLFSGECISIHYHNPAIHTHLQSLTLTWIKLCIPTYIHKFHTYILNCLYCINKLNAPTHTTNTCQGHIGQTFKPNIDLYNYAFIYS